MNKSSVTGRSLLYMNLLCMQSGTAREAIFWQPNSFNTNGLKFPDYDEKACITNTRRLVIRVK